MKYKLVRATVLFIAWLLRPFCYCDNDDLCKYQAFNLGNDWSFVMYAGVCLVRINLEKDHLIRYGYSVFIDGVTQRYKAAEYERL